MLQARTSRVVGSGPESGMSNAESTEALRAEIAERKVEVRIYDYVDDRVPVLDRMYGRRLAGYRSIGYEPEAVLKSQGGSRSRRRHRWLRATVRSFGGRSCAAIGFPLDDRLLGL